MRGCRGHFWFYQPQVKMATASLSQSTTSWRNHSDRERVISLTRDSWRLITIATASRQQLYHQEPWVFLSTPGLPLSLLAIMRLSYERTNHSVAHRSPASLTKQTNQITQNKHFPFQNCPFPLLTMKRINRKLFQMRLIFSQIVVVWLSDSHNSSQWQALSFPSRQQRTESNELDDDDQSTTKWCQGNLSIWRAVLLLL